METEKTNDEKKNGDGKLFEIEDKREMALIATYLVQMGGMVTQAEIQKKAREKLGVHMDGRTLPVVLKGLAKQNILAIEMRQVKGGTTEKHYSMKMAGWKAPPEYAHFRDLLPELEKTPEAIKIKGWFDDKEKGGESKATRGNVIDDFRIYRVKIVTEDALLGSQIPCQFTDAVRKQHPNVLDQDEKVELGGIWERDPMTGDYLIGADVLQGWFTTNVVRLAGLPDARGSYVAFQPIRIPKDTKVQQLVLPVVNARTGPAAPKAYEALPPPLELTMTFTAPVKGFLLPEQVEKLVIAAGRDPRRGISPARGKRYGHFLVVGFECLGVVKDQPIDALLENVPAALAAKYRGYLDDARKRLAGVTIAGAAQHESSSEPFPGSDSDESED